MKLRISELQKSNNKARKIRTERLKDVYKEVDRIWYHQKLLFVLEAIQIKLISQYNDNQLVEYFDIDKIRELIGQKYYWPSFRKNIKAYIKNYDICLGLKTVRHKSYNDPQFLPVFTY